MSVGLRLLLLASRHGPEPVAYGELMLAVRAIDDWAAFLALVDRHRVAALVYRSLKDCPEVEPYWLEALRSRVKANTLRALLQVRELIRIGKCLEQRGIGCLGYKGPVLAMQAYGDIALRHAGDLDLVVAPDAALEAEALLSELGYVQVYPGCVLTPRQRRVYRRRFADFIYVHTEHRLKLELHWRFFGNPWLFQLDSARVFADSSPLLLAGHTVAAMRPVDLLLSLCVHGAKHGWFRLFWLADVNVLLQGRSAQDMLRLLVRAREQGVDRMLLQGVLLAHRLYHTPVAIEVLQAAEADAQVDRLVKVALEAIQEPGAQWGGARTLARVLAMQGYSMRLRKGVRYRWRVLTEGFVRPEDWQRFPLPDTLFFLYWPLRLVLRYWPRRPGAG